MGFAGRTGRMQIRHRKKFVFRERFRYNKRAEVSICKLRKSDTCVFALTPRKFFPVPDSIFSRSAMLSSLSACYPGASLIYTYTNIPLYLLRREIGESLFCIAVMWQKNFA